MDLVYNDPGTADFEPRPVLPRTPPEMPVPATTPGAYSGRFVCSSVFFTQEAEVRRRGYARTADCTKRSTYILRAEAAHCAEL